MFFSCSYTDIKEKRIYLPLVIFFLISALLISGKCFVMGLIPGMLLLIYSLLSSEKLGQGDAYMIMTEGLIRGCRENIILICAAFIMAAVISAMLMVFGKVKKTDTLPFVPFLAIAYVICLIIRI